MRGAASTERYVGREAEALGLETLVRAGARLVTVTGAPGIGKTTFVERWLRGAALERDGWITHRVDAGQLRTADELTQAVAGATGVSDGEDIPGALGRTAAVLFIDELEAIADQARAPLEAWLTECAELLVVATSRRRLGGLFERVFELGPLADADAAVLLRRCLEDAGLPSRGDAVESLAEALDGVPLAIELAAARCRVLSPEELRRRLPSAQTLYGEDIARIVDGSLEALDPAAQATFAKLGVFEGSFDADSAERVIGGSILESLQQLSDAHLLSRREDGLRLLTPLRSAARARLQPSERGALEERHRTWVCEQAEVLPTRLAGPSWRDARADLSRLRADLLASARRASDAESTATLLIALDEVRRFLGLGVDLAAWMDELITRGGEISPERSAELRLRRAHLAAQVGDFARVDALLTEVADRWPATRVDPRTTMLATHGQLVRAELAGAKAALEEALGEAKGRADRHAQAALRSTLIEVYRSLGQYDRAITEGERSLLDQHHPLDRAPTLTGLSFAASESGAGEDALRYAREGLDVLDQAHDRPSRTRAALTLALGRAHHLHGELTEALEACTTAAAGPDAFVATFATAATAMIRVEQDRLVEARDLLRAIQEEVARRMAMYGPVAASLLAAIETRLGEPKRAAARIEGALELARELPPFVADIVEDCAVVVGTHPTRERPPARLVGPLAIEARIAQRLVAAHLSANPLPSLRVSRLRVAHTGEWFEAVGARVSVARRPVMRRILVALATAHRARPGESLGHPEILASGWGDEKMSPRSRRRRIEVMMSRIRALGVEDALETTPAGYRLHPECAVVLVEEVGAGAA